MILKSLETFVEIAKNKPKKKIAVVAAEDEPVLIAIKEALKQEIVEPILVGNIHKINEIAQQIDFDIKNLEIIDEPNPAQSARISVELVRNGKAQILMKGMINTADYLRAILDKETGLRKGALLSHIGFFETPNYHKLIAITDAAQNIAPDFQEKVSILTNSIELFNRLGINNPKIAIIAAVETVNPKMPATIDAALLTMMNRRGQIKNCIIDGPLAFDNAISYEAAHHKGIISEVAGDADLLFMPDIEAGNVAYKCMTYFGMATVAAVILGAAVPIVLTSRADNEKSKLMSIALAASF